MEFSYRKGTSLVYKRVLTLLIILFALIIGVASSFYTYNFFVLFLGIFIFSTLLFLMAAKTEKTVSNLTIIMISSLFLLPSYSVAGFGLRLEDFIVVILGIFMLFVFFRKYVEIETSFNKWIFAFTIYVFLISIINIVFNNLNPVYLFYYLKEVQYFIYFFVLLYATRYAKFRIKFIKLLLIMSLVTMAWGAYQLLFNNTVGYYGIGVLSETSSSQSGGLYFLISVFFLYMINITKRNIKRTVYFLLFIGSVGLVLATVSRTAIMALTVVYPLYMIFTIFRIKAIRVVIWLYVIILTSPILYWLLRDYLYTITERLSRIDSGSSIRSRKWEWILSYGSDLGFVFGEGRGFAQTVTGGFTLGTDSQYVRNILELGAVGTTLFMFIILGLLFFAFKNLKSMYAESLFIILVTVGFLVMSVTHEVFLVTIQASMFWILMGGFVGLIIHAKKDQNRSKVQLEQTVWY
ncbi:hypothetical protein NKS27_17415 [Peribacillus frigoritolerans]|uniref:hypothetical protein n=1 Tax=Peribacillus frigoritolerans TaxID=450367 RepID=UPI00209E39CD|nr:hypothetical protein [Peribacillus frigoritolerans]MCP1154172.1 hypothetical protein [Peribacillus frigoritolerans]